MLRIMGNVEFDEIAVVYVKFKKKTFFCRKQDDTNDIFSSFHLFTCHVIIAVATNVAKKTIQSSIHKQNFF